MCAIKELELEKSRAVCKDKLLAKCAEVLTSETSGNILESFCKAIYSNTKHAIVLLVLYDEKRNRVQSAAFSGHASVSWKKGQIDVSKILRPESFNIKEILITDNQADKYPSIIDVPLIDRKKGIIAGLLHIEAEEPEFFNAFWCEVYEKIAAQILFALKNVAQKDEITRIEAKLKEEDEKFNTLLDIVSDGIWEWTFNSSNPRIDENNFKILKHHAKGKFNPKIWQDLLCGDEKPSFLEGAKNFTKGTKKHFDFLSVVPVKDAESRKILLRAIMTRKEDNKCKLTGTFEDIAPLMHFNEIKEELDFRQMLMDSIPMPLTFKNTKLQYQGCNIAFEQLMGVKRKELAGKTALDVYPSEYAKPMMETEKKIIAVGGMKNTERTLKSPTGEKRFFMEFATAYYKPDGTIGGLLTTLIDLTEHKKAEDELIKSKERYKIVSEFSPEMIYWLDENNFIQYLSPYCEELTEYEISEYMSNHELLEKIVHPEDYSVWQDHIKSFNKKGSMSPCEFRILTKNGNIKWVRHICRIVTDSQGKYMGRRGCYSDITILMKLEEELINARDRLKERVKDATAELSTINKQLKSEIKLRIETEASLRQSERCFRDIAETSPVALVIVNMNYNKVLFINPQAAKLFAVEGQPLESIESPMFYVDLDARRKMLDEFAKSGRINNYEIQMRKADGNTFYASISILKGTYQEQEVGYAGIIDITESKMFEKHLATTIKAFQQEIIARRNIENALSEKEERYRLLFENMTGGFALHKIHCDAGGVPIDYRFMEVNPAYTKLMAMKSEEIIGKLASEVIPLMEKPLLKLFGRVALTGNPCSLEYYNKHKDRYFDIYIFSTRKHYFATIFNDITERKKMEEALKTSEYQYRKLTETVQVGIWQLSKEGKITFINQKMCEMLEIDSINDLANDSYFRFIPEDSISLIRQEHDRLSNGFMSNYEAKLISKKNKTLDVIVSGMALFNHKGQFQSYIETFTDITDRKKAEKAWEEQRLQLIQADKMVSLGTLVAGVAHEINNPTNFIMLNSPILYDSWKSIIPILENHYEKNGDFIIAGLQYSEMRDFIPSLFSGILEGAERIRNIVSGLKNYARQDNEMLTSDVDVNKVITSSLALISNMVKKATNNLKINLSENLPFIKGSHQRLEQIVINLLQNACQAMTDRQKSLYVSTYFKDNKVTIKIEDEGIGIPEKDLSKIMDPFFTTKRDSGGTGLGLAISAGIVKDLKGEIIIQSTLGKGTAASVCLPPAKKEE